MNFKFLLFLIFSCSFFVQIEAQKRTTSVRGYTRKDGTYVRPHTRSYTAGSGYSSYNSNTNFSSEEDYSYKNLSKEKENSDSKYLTKTSDYDGETIEVSKLNAIQNTDTSNEEGNVIYISVLYYNDKIIDICPIPRSIINKWDFDDVYHYIDKDEITSEHALDLISNYNWNLYKEKISKGFKYTSERKFPPYLKKKIESIKLKL